MKGYQFHAEMPDSWASKSGCKSHRPFTRALLKEWAAEGKHCPIIAVLQGPEHRLVSDGEVTIECFGSVYGHDNSAVCGTSVSRAYLDERTVRIDEATARKLHPALFQFLDD